MLMLAQCWLYLVYPTPTISQRSNGLPTLAQRTHATWVSLLSLNFLNEIDVEAWEYERTPK